MSRIGGRKRLMPWYIGLGINFVIILLAGWELATGGCGAPPAALVMALIIMPVIYIALMYLTLTSQA